LRKLGLHKKKGSDRISIVEQREERKKEWDRNANHVIFICKDVWIWILHEFPINRGITGI